MIALPVTVSPLEIVWTCISLLGVVLATINWYDAFGDLLDLRRSGRNGVLMIAAVGEFRDHAMIFTTLVCDFLIGVLALFALPGREADGDPSLSSFVTPPLMIVGAMALIYLSFAKKRRRKQILSALRGEQDDVASRRHIELSASLTQLHHEIDGNTRLTEHAAERADAAYHEANNVNLKIVQTNQASTIAIEAGNRLMVDLETTGIDTNVRVRNVEDAVVASDIRMDQIEAAQAESNDASDT